MSGSLRDIAPISGASHASGSAFSREAAIARSAATRTSCCMCRMQHAAELLLDGGVAGKLRQLLLKLLQFLGALAERCPPAAESIPPALRPTPDDAPPRARPCRASARQPIGGARRPSSASRPPPGIWSSASRAARCVRSDGLVSPAVVATGSAISMRAYVTECSPTRSSGKRRRRQQRRNRAPVADAPQGFGGAAPHRGQPRLERGNGLRHRLGVAPQPDGVKGRQPHILVRIRQRPPDGRPRIRAPLSRQRPDRVQSLGRRSP